MYFLPSEQSVFHLIFLTTASAEEKGSNTMPEKIADTQHTLNSASIESYPLSQFSQ